MGQLATQEQVWPSIEHSASLLKSVRLNATVALGQTFRFNISDMDVVTRLDDSIHMDFKLSPCSH